MMDTSTKKATKTMVVLPPPMKKKRKVDDDDDDHTVKKEEVIVELTADERRKLQLKNDERRISHIIWEQILASAYEMHGEMLKDAQGRYNRALVYTIVRDYVTEMMVCNGGITFNCKHGSLSVHCARFNQIQSDKFEKKIVNNVQKVINRWTTGKGDFKKQMKNYPTTHLKEDQSWENQKEQIMQNIIEPFLQRQEERDGMSQIVVPPPPPPPPQQQQQQQQQPTMTLMVKKSTTTAADDNDDDAFPPSLKVKKNNNEDEFIEPDDDDDDDEVDDEVDEDER